MAMKRPSVHNLAPNLDLIYQIQKNTKTKKRREKKHFAKNFKGKVIDGVHELYTLTMGMMLGLRVSVRLIKQPQQQQSTSMRVGKIPCMSFANKASSSLYLFRAIFCSYFMMMSLFPTDILTYII
jgi:hypothetical protein